MNYRSFIFTLVTGVVMLCVCDVTVSGDPPADEAVSGGDQTSAKAADETAKKASDDGGSADDSTPPKDPPADKPLELSQDVRDALLPMFSRIAKADASRAIAVLTAESLLGGKVIESETSTYQIATKSPNQYTVLMKSPSQRTRIYSDGKSMVISMGDTAYIRMAEAMQTQQAVLSLPVPLGPYPEPILALTFAGVDPAISLLGGMKSVDVIERKEFKPETPAVRIRGVQKDAVSWDLWVTDEKEPEPLQLLIDLTSMLRSTQQVSIPKDFVYRLRIEFRSWRIGGEIDSGLFEYRPSKDAKEYASMQEYYESISGVAAQHPLLGKPLPEFKAKTLAGKSVVPAQLENKVAVVDFWATWCKPCVAAIPVLQEVTSEYADKGVVFYAVNTGEDIAEVEQFLKDQQWQLDVLVDDGASVAEAFQADAIPQTMVIGKNGIVESVHIGFPGSDELRKRLREELDVLVVGGRIASADEPAQEGSEDQE